MSDLIGIVIIGLIIYGVVTYRKKSKQKFMELPQYQIYIQALEVLKNSGYEIKESNTSHALVYQDSRCYGQIFVVKYPVWIVSLIPLLRSWSDYETMIRVVESIRNSRNRSEIYWPQDSFVGGFTVANYGPYSFNNEWLRILESVIG